MFTLKNIYLKPLLFLFLLTPLLISAQGPSADSHKSNKKTKITHFIKHTLNKPLKFLKKNEVEIGFGSAQLPIIKKLDKSPIYSVELTAKVNNWLIILNTGSSNNEYSNHHSLNSIYHDYSNGYISNQIKPLYVYKTMVSFTTINSISIGYEKEYDIKKIKGLSLGLGLLGSIGKTTSYDYGETWEFHDSIGNPISSSDIFGDEYNNESFHDAFRDYYYYEGLYDKNIHANTSDHSRKKYRGKLAGITNSFALSYKLTNRIGFRFRKKIIFEKYLKNDFLWLYHPIAWREREGVIQGLPKVRSQNTFSLFYKF